MAGDPCRIEVVEAGSGLPAPLVELRTVSHVRLVSDNAGLIAFDLPECMGQETWFQVIGHGYEAPQDGFGQRGVRLTPQPGGRLRVEVHAPASRGGSGRITGSGLFAESQQLGQPSPVPETGVVGCDSVQTAEHRGKLFWIWGDTNLAHYPLGVFHATAATSSLKPLDSYDPPLALRLDYFRGPRGRPRGVAPIEGKGPTWLSGLVSLPDGQGQPRLAASYVKVEPPLTVWQKGLCLWNETSQQFERHAVIWMRGDPLEQEAPEGHAVFWRDREGQRWLLFGNPFPRLQMPATLQAWQDPQTWRSLPTPATLRDAAESRSRRQAAQRFHRLESAPATLGGYICRGLGNAFRVGRSLVCGIRFPAGSLVGGGEGAKPPRLFVLQSAGPRRVDAG